MDHRLVYLTPEEETGAEMVILSLFPSFTLDEFFAYYKKKGKDQDIETEENHKNEAVFHKSETLFWMLFIHSKLVEWN